MNKSHLTEEQLLQNDEDLFVANTAIFHGLQQYWTPPPLAQWLHDVMVALYGEPAVQNALVCDLTAGAGNLLKPYQHPCGVEVDKTVMKPGLNVVNADVVSFYPYMQQHGIQFDLMALNPPYAEYWPRKAFLSEAHEAEKIESQVAAILAASHLLTYYGVGYAVISTKILPKLQQEFPRLTGILRVNEVFAPHADVPVAVVFFRSINAYYQDKECIELGTCTMGTLPKPHTIAHSLRFVMGRRLSSSAALTASNLETWRKACTLYKKDQKKRAWTYNLEVQGKRVKLSFTNFQRHALNEKPSVNPLSYYVFNPDQLTTLKQQIETWNGDLPYSQQITIDPDLETALAQAQKRSERELTPYYPLKEFQKLGWYHSMSEIRCIETSEEHGFRAGKTYPIQTRVSDGSNTTTKQNDASTTRIETRWKYLSIEIEGEEGPVTFTEDKGADTLIRHFELPDVPDVATKYPEEYAAHLKRIEAMQDRYHFKEYQKDLLARILTKKQDALRTLLSAEQGMGKTRMSLALIELLGVEKALIVTKTKVLNHFPAEAKKVSFPVPVHKITDVHSAVMAKQAKRGVFVTTYSTLYTKAVRGKQVAEWLGEDEKKGRKRLLLNGKPVYLNLEREHIGYGTSGRKMWTTRFKGIYNIIKNAFRSGLVILDETTTAKKKQNKVSKAVYSLKGKHRVGLSGEPIDNYLNDIYWTCIWLFGESNSLFPYSRKTAKQFVDDYLKVEYKTIIFESDCHDKRSSPKPLPEIANVSLLWKLIAPLFIVRRWSDLDSDDMVGLNIRLWNTPFASEQLQAYEEWQEAMKKFITIASGKSNGNGFVHTIGGYHNKLRLMVCLPNAESLRYAVGRDEDGERRDWGGEVLTSAFTPKVERILTLLTGHLEQEQQCVLMTMYKEEAAFYTNLLKSYGVPVGTVTGEVTPSRLERINQRFHDGELRVIVATVLACAEGIDWNWCSKMIFSTTTWRASKLRQAMHRCRRINSTQDVTVDLVLTKESIDWRAYNLQLRKGRSSDMCLQGELKQEYEAQDMKTLMYEAIKRIKDEDQESLTVIEQRCRQMLEQYRQEHEQPQHNIVQEQQHRAPAPPSVVLPNLPLIPVPPKQRQTRWKKQHQRAAQAGQMALF